MSTHDAPVRQADQQRPQTQPIRHPRAVTAQRMLGGGGSSGSVAAHTASTTSASSARMMSVTSPVGWCLGRTRHHSRANPPTGGWSPHPNTRLTPIRESLASIHRCDL